MFFDEVCHRFRHVATAHQLKTVILDTLAELNVLTPEERIEKFCDMGVVLE